MKLFCDMDGVLVRQTSMQGFHLMPWMADGKELWAFIKQHNPILLTQVREERFGATAQEKLLWINRELGPAVPVIFTPDSRGKGPFASHGAILIDDDVVRHGPGWTARGGMLVRHTCAAETIRQLRKVL